MRTSSSSNPVERNAIYASPEGRPSLAHRFSGGKSVKNEASPGGTTEFSRTLGLPLRAFSAGCSTPEIKMQTRKRSFSKIKKGRETPVNHQHRSFATLASAMLTLFFLIACQQSQQQPAPTAAESKAAATEKVFVTFEGPWASAPDPKDANSVLLVAPKTKAHRDLYVKASNEATLAAGIYQLSVPGPSGAAAGAYDPAILRAQIDPRNVQHLLDTKLDRYVIRLPKPEAYLPSGRARSRVGPTYPPDPSTEKEYATGVSLRYTVSTLNGFSLAGTPDTGGAFNPLLLQVDTPSILFAINSSEIDDVCNTHSRTAFRDLVQSLGVTLYVDFPDNPGNCHGKDPQMARPAKANAIPASLPERLAAMLGGDLADAQTAEVTNGIPAPYLRWLRSSRVVGSIAQHLAAVASLFGLPSGHCISPTIAGGG
jgi:hypothetical protein